MCIRVTRECGVVMLSVTSVRVSVSVCLSCSGSNFWEPWPGNFIFGMYATWFVSFDLYERTQNCVRNNPVLMTTSIFSLTQYSTSKMLYLILCLRYRLQISLEGCLMKLIYLSLKCCCDINIVCWAYMSVPWLCSSCMFILIKLCKLCCCCCCMYLLCLRVRHVDIICKEWRQRS